MSSDLKTISSITPETKRWTAKTMSSDLKTFGSITPETKRWTAMVRVMEKSSPRSAVESSKKYQKMIFVDNQRNRIQETIFKPDIELFKETLQPFHYYYISNAPVKFIQRQHRLVDNEFQWTINAKTPTREVPEVDINNQIINTPFNLVPFSKLSSHINSSTQIDVIALSIDIYPPKLKGPNTLQMRPTLIALWNDFISNEGAYITQAIETHPILLETHLKVTSFNGVPINKGVYYIFIQPTNT